MEMIGWAELPHPALRKIVGMLSIVDIINFANTCENWKNVAVKSIKSVKIDGSSAYNGSWTNFNKIGLVPSGQLRYLQPGTAKSGEDPHQFLASISDIVKLAASLTELTDEIQHLHFHGDMVPADTLQILLSRQKSVKTLEVKFPTLRLAYYDYKKVSAALQIHKMKMAVLLEGIVRHEASLEVIKIGIKKGHCLQEVIGDYHDYCVSFKDLVQGLGDKPKYFPNLKSIQFLSHYLNTEEATFAELFFERTFNNNKILKIDIQANLFLEELFSNIDKSNKPWKRLLTKYFKLGQFSNLREINIDMFSGCHENKFDEDDADILIRHCPKITRISSDEHLVAFAPQEEALVKLLKHYGPQLTHLHCKTNAVIAEVIVQNCPNLERLGIVDDSGSCLEGLEKLKKLQMSYVESATLRRLVKVLGGLTELKIGRALDIEVLSVIRRNGRSLQSLHVGFFSDTWEDFISVFEALLFFLAEFHCLEKLSFTLYGDYCKSSNNNIFLRWKGSDKITELLLKNQSKLRKLHIDSYWMSPKNKLTLVEALPFCKIVFKSRYNTFVDNDF